MAVTLNVFVSGPNGPIAGARVVCLTKNQIIDPPTRTTSGDGGCNLYFNGPPFNPPIAVSLAIDADGYQPWCSEDSPIGLGSQSQDFKVTLKPSFKRPFKPAPRVWAGNMCGMRIQDLPPVLGGAFDSSLVLSWFYDRYDAAWRTIIRKAWKTRGYTHVLLSWPDSRLYGQTPQQFAATCRELIADGFYPCVMLSAKDIDPPDVPTIQASIMRVMPSLIGMVPVFGVGWELSLWLSPTQVQQLIDWLAPQVTPLSRLYVHFQQGYGSFQQDGDVFADFWNLNVGKLTGLLHQKVLEQTPQQYRFDSGGLTDILERFAGGWGCSGDSGFGHPFDLVALEISAMTQFDGSTTEAQGDALGTWAAQTPAVNGVSVMGSGNGTL